MTERMWARVEQNLVVELVSLPEQFTPGINIFGSDLNFVDVSTVSGIALLWVQNNNGSFEPPQNPAVPPLTKTNLLAYAAKVRYNKQIAGITFNGAPIDTGDRSQGLISGAVSLLNNASSLTSVDFKTANGTWITIPRANMIALGVAVGTYIQACFSTEQSIDTAINNGSITTETAIDNADWPSQTISS